MEISPGAGFGDAPAFIPGVELVSGGGVVVNAFAMVPTLIILFMSRFRRPRRLQMRTRRR